MTEKLRASPFHCPHCAAKYGCCPKPGIYSVQTRRTPISPCTGGRAAGRSPHGKAFDFDNIAIAAGLNAPCLRAICDGHRGLHARRDEVLSGRATAQRNFLAECIEAHFKNFNEQCRTALVRTAAVREACKADIEQQCPTARRSRSHPAVREKTFRCARSVLQGRDRPRGRAQSWVLLSIGRAGVGLIAIFLMLQYRKRSLYASALLLGPNMRPRITVFFTWRKVSARYSAHRLPR
jgi:hypothetical protein